MQKLVFKFDPTLKKFEPMEYCCEGICFIAYCIIDMGPDHHASHIQWADSTKKLYTLNHLLELEKDKDFIEVKLLCHDGSQTAPFHRLSNDEFQDIIHKLYMLYYSGAIAIVVKHSNNKFEIEGEWPKIQTVTLEKTTGFKSYSTKSYVGDCIGFLGWCFSDFCLEDYNNYMEWALDPEKFLMGFNVISLEKTDDYILIGSDLSEQEDGGPFYKITILEFIKLLPKWKILVELEMDTITFIDNDGVLDVTGE